MTERLPLEGRRRWIKLYPHECLYGSIRYQLTPEERSVWYDLLCFAGMCKQPGTISDNDLRPFPHSFIANRLNITEKLLNATIKKCAEERRLGENDTGIHILNWKYYQSEYDRVKEYQKKYHAEKKAGEE